VALIERARMKSAARPLMPNGTAGLITIPRMLTPTIPANGPRTAKTRIASRANLRADRER
jgi:hypothetical protein